MLPEPHHPYPLKPLTTGGILARSLGIYLDNLWLLTGIALCCTAPDALLRFIARWQLASPATETSEIVRVAWQPPVDIMNRLAELAARLSGPAWQGPFTTVIEWGLRPVAIGALFVALESVIRGHDCTVTEAFTRTRGRRLTLIGTHLLVMLMIYAAAIAGVALAAVPGVALIAVTGFSLGDLAGMFLLLILAVPILLLMAAIPPVIVFLRTVFALCAAAVEKQGAADAIGRSWRLFRSPVAAGFFRSHEWRLTIILTVTGIVATFAALASAVPQVADFLTRGGPLLGDTLGGFGLPEFPSVSIPPWTLYLFFGIESLFPALAIIAIAVPVHTYFTDFRVRLEGYPMAHPAPESPPVSSATPEKRHYLD